MNGRGRLVRNVAAVVTPALATAAVCISLHAQAATSGTVVCSNNPCTVQAVNAGSGDGFDGLVVRGAAGINHALLVTDQGGAPILFTNTNSVSSGDLPFCSTSTDLSNRVCIYPGTWNAAAGQYQGPGYVELWPSATGAPVKLSIADVQEIHKLEAAKVTAADLRWLARAAR